MMLCWKYRGKFFIDFKRSIQQPDMATSKDITLVNLDLEPHQVILRPIVTEKGYEKAEHENVYFFEVNRLSNKAQIKHAIEVLFDVKVVEVRPRNQKASEFVRVTVPTGEGEIGKKRW